MTPLKKYRTSATPIFLALLIAAVGFALWAKENSTAQTPLPAAFEGLSLETDQKSYFHDALVRVNLKAGTQETQDAVRRSTNPVEAWVERDGVPVTTVGETKKFRLVFNQTQAVWTGRWPVPWNAPDGNYALKLSTLSVPPGVGPVEEKSFRIESRSFEAVPKGFAVLTLEGLGSLQRFPGPDNPTPHLESMAEWAEFIGADAVLIQGAESSGHTAKLSSSFPWLMRSTQPVSALARACHERGIRLGVYILSFMVGGDPKFSPDYAYGWHYENGRPVYGLDRAVRRGISIRDDKRPADIVKVLDRWSSVEGVDFLGLDYIRPVFGGNELVDDFIKDMPDVQKPEGYDHWTKEQRMTWIARSRYIAPTAAQRKEVKFRTTDQWFWYRAHRTAGVVRKIVEDFAGKKPLWAFTLSWQKGWEHGQDPAMMRDAGVDINGIMLYEADGRQYKGLLSQWNGYTANGSFNLVGGNTFDWRLHQRTLNPSGPEEMVHRMMAAVEQFQEGRPLRGIFVHDLARGLRGVLGPYPPREWFLAAGGAITRLREIHGVTPYRLKFDVPASADAGEEWQCRLTLDGPADEDSISVRVYVSSDVEVSATSFHLSREKPSATFTARWKPTAASSARGDRAFVAVRSFHEGRAEERAQVHARYVQGSRRPAQVMAPKAP